MNTYTMDAPHTYKELRQWPRDICKEYLAKLKDKYDPTYVQLGEMLDASHNTVVKLLQDAGLTTGDSKSRNYTHKGRRGPRQAMEWATFMNGSETHEKASPSDDSSDNTGTPDGAHNAPEVNVASHSANDAPVIALTVSLEGKPCLVFDRAFRMLDDAEYEITIRAVRKEAV